MLKNKLFSLALLGSLTVKVAFLYVDEKDCFKMGVGKPLRPTYRISMHLYPKVTTPKFTVALSELSKDGVVKPYGVMTVVDHAR